MTGALLALLLFQIAATPIPSTAPSQPEVLLSPAKPGEKCVIEGAVLKATTGDPLKKAVLTLRRAEGHHQPKSATTDASGHFQLKDIEPGRYRLFAARNGYVDQEYGQRTPEASGAILTLTAGQHLKDISFRLIPAAVIAGHVRDEDGEPVTGAEVQALRFHYEKGQRKLIPVAEGQANDLGEYRLYGLDPGQYYVSASYVAGWFGDEAPEGGYAPVYYPGSDDPSRTTPIALRAGDELPGIDFTLVPVRTFNVKGRVYDGANLRPGVHTMVGLMPRDPEVQDWGFSSTTVVQDPQGAFELHDVKPGSYYLGASSMDDDRRGTAREALVVSNSDVEGINLVIGPGTDVRGRLDVQGKALLNLNLLEIWLRPRDENLDFGGRASIKSDGTFILSNVSDDNYQAQVQGLPEDFYLYAVRLSGDDVLESGLNVSRKQPPGLLEVLVSPNGGRVEGLVLKDDKPFSGATVTLIPESDRRKQERLYKSTTTDQNGQFSLRGIAPGDYKLFAWETIEEGAYQDPESLRPYEERGKPIHVDEGSRLNSQLQLIIATEPAAY
jgi:protocatechuate 3,4-dioxygenase beta subunit